MNPQKFFVGRAIGILVVLAIILGVYMLTRQNALAPVVMSFETCMAAGYPVMESHPRQCKTPAGLTYAEEIPQQPTYSNASADLITVETPFPGAVTGKEFSVIGEARGTWFFEASFPVELIDKDGKTLAIAVAQAQGEWMTEEFVPFKATIKAPDSYIGPATLVLHKDNPSGLPEHDASISFPITVEY
jgi:hypothetical protein